MTTQKGHTMADEDRRTLRTVLIVFISIFSICFALAFLPIKGNLFHFYFVRAELAYKAVGIAMIPVYYWFLLKKWGDLDSSAGQMITWQAAFMFGVPVLILSSLFGFNLSL